MGFSNSGVALSTFSSSVIVIFIFISIFLLFTINPSSSVKVCKPASCGPMGPLVRFPFRLIGQQDKGCGYPGFDLYCSNNGDTILRLPLSGGFVALMIDYSKQAIFINDLDQCFSKSILNFSADGSAFRAGPGHKYKFFNCSGDSSEYQNTVAVPLLCFYNNSPILVRPNGDPQSMPPTCSLMPNVSIPLQLFTFSEEPDIGYNTVPTLALIWKEPACQTCEEKRWNCGRESDSGLDVGCLKPPGEGLSRGARDGIILGVGIPGLMCLIGLVCYVLGKIKNLDRHESLELPSSSSAPALNPDSSGNINGRDASTIESYPTTTTGESCRLPEKCGSSCPICLRKYRPKQILSCIPECNHYFHASCLNTWVRTNRTCPVCRNSLETNSVTPSSSQTSTLSISSTLLSQ